MRVFIQRQKEQQGGNNTESSIPFECKQGVFALLPTAEHVLSQQFTTGCVLPMPVSSVLDSDIIPVTEVDKSGSGVSTSTSATTSSTEEEEMDFEALLTGGEKGGSAGGRSGSVVVNDASISADVWMTLLRSKSAHFEFQIRKYG